MKWLIVKNRRPVFAAVLCAAAVAVVVCVRSSSAEPAAKGADADIYTVIYKMVDLPVWRLTPKGPQFDPSAVMALIEATVAPQSWDGVGGPGSMAQYDEQESLVISQTRENHIRVLELIKSLRAAQEPPKPDAALETTR